MFLVLILIWLEYKFFDINLFKYRGNISLAKLCDLYEKLIWIVFLKPHDQRYAKLKQLYTFLLKRKGLKNSFRIWLKIIWEVLDYFMFGVIFKIIVRLAFIVILVILMYLSLDYLHKHGLF